MRILGVRLYLLALLLLVALPLPYLMTANVPVGGKLVVRSHPQPNTFVFAHGGRQIFPHYRLVALYGTPGTPALGVLGEQDAEASVARVKALAADYQPLMNEHAMPTLEIIATVASASPTDDGDYSYAVSSDVLDKWVSTARQAGVYVVLDLQTGRSTFLDQAKALEPLLALPNVGLALDPEWRLNANQLPLEQIGSVSIDEVNQTARWLAALTKAHALPQKLLLLHEFSLAMLPDRQKLDTGHPELAYVIQMDGQGNQAVKLDTWHAILQDAPANVYFGWKNFTREDQPMLSAADTMKLTPQPWYVSYQ